MPNKGTYKKIREQINIDAPAEYFVDLDANASNSDIVQALASNKVVRLSTPCLRWATSLNLNSLKKMDTPKDMGGNVTSMLLHCRDGIIREFYAPLSSIANNYARFYGRDIPTPEMWRDDIKKELPSWMWQNGPYDFRRFVPYNERGDNHDIYIGFGRFAAGLHIDEGRLMGVNGCAKGCNTWYFVHSEKVVEFERAVVAMLDLHGVDKVWTKRQEVIMDETQFRQLLVNPESLRGHVFRLVQHRGQFLIFNSGWGHQVVTEGPPTVKVAWALLPYLSLSQSVRAIQEYRMEKRTLVDNAGKAILNGAHAMLDEYKQGGKVHLRAVEELVCCLEGFGTTFKKEHEKFFLHKQHVMEFVGVSPYCASCQTAFFYWFSCEIKQSARKINRCYECTVKYLGELGLPLFEGKVEYRDKGGSQRRIDLHAEYGNRKSVWNVKAELQTIAYNGEFVWNARCGDKSGTSHHNSSLCKDLFEFSRLDKEIKGLEQLRM